MNGEVVLVRKIILSVSVTFLLITPITVNLIYATLPEHSSDECGEIYNNCVSDYALHFTGGGPVKDGWYGPDRFKELAYFSFFTFFKCGIDPDCIDMVDEDKDMI